jgi:hypothetical protein
MLRSLVSLVLALALVVALVMLARVAAEQGKHRPVESRSIVDDALASDPPSASEIDDGGADVAASPALTR